MELAHWEDRATAGAIAGPRAARRPMFGVGACSDTPPTRANPTTARRQVHPSSVAPSERRHPVADARSSKCLRAPKWHRTTPLPPGPHANPHRRTQNWKHAGALGQLALASTAAASSAPHAGVRRPATTAWPASATPATKSVCRPYGTRPPTESSPPTQTFACADRMACADPITCAIITAGISALPSTPHSPTTPARAWPHGLCRPKCRAACADADDHTVSPA